jgi:hypothetical protein
MHHFLWGRGDLAQRANGYFDRVRPLARWHTSERQGYRGVRWPKMVGPPEKMVFADGFKLYTGPSGAGPWLLWQQPHPLVFAELAYRQRPGTAVLSQFNATVHDTADFMADFILHGPIERSGCRSLGPPVFTAEIESNEGHPATDTSNPTFSLAYWKYGLDLAITWRARLKLAPELYWQAAHDALCPVRPRHYAPAKSEVYFPYSNSSTFAPSKYATQLFAAVFAPVALSNRTVLRATLVQAVKELKVLEGGLPWCCNYPMYAIAAARLGMPELAASLILLPNSSMHDSTYRANGQCRMGNFLPVYTSANGALLAAVAMLMGGWDGDGGGRLPGLPRDGSWDVEAEGFAKAL